MNNVHQKSDSNKDQRQVREHYAAALKRATSSNNNCGCGQKDQNCCSQVDILYQDSDVKDLPKEVTEISFGSGDPVTLAALEPGQTVLDLGSGGGIDCFLAAQKVGPGGHVIGVDMTPEMIDRARENKTRVKADNVEFRLGEIEHLPVADQSIDTVISNCVINLSFNKQQVFNEIYRVLKPGGKLAVSDFVADRPLPQEMKDNTESWCSCVSGALEKNEYISMLEKAGFTNVEIIPAFGTDGSIANGEEETIDIVYSAKITAKK